MTVTAVCPSTILISRFSEERLDQAFVAKDNKFQSSSKMLKTLARDFYFDNFQGKDSTIELMTAAAKHRFITAEHKLTFCACRVTSVSI